LGDEGTDMRDVPEGDTVAGLSLAVWFTPGN